MKDTNKIGQDKHEFKLIIEVAIVNMYFLIFQPEDILKLCLNFNEYQTICAYKRYTYKKSSFTARMSLEALVDLSKINLSGQKIKVMCHFSLFYGIMQMT